MQSLRLVVLVFEECFELHGEGLLFVVGCWLLCEIVMSGRTGFHSALLGLLLFLLFEVMLAVLCNLYS